MQIKTIKTILGFLLWGSAVLPIYFFQEVFKLQIDDFAGLYDNSIIFISFLYWFFVALYLWLSPKYFQKKIYKSIIVVMYIIFYILSCTAIGFDYCVYFGNTWRYSEVLLELIINKWYFYIFGMLGLIFHFVFQWLIHKNS
jgi:hypothetical protein